MQWHMQSGGITTNLKIKIYFTLHELSATKIVMWSRHADYSAKGIYDIILGIYLLTALWLNLKFYDQFIEAYDGPFKYSTS